MWTWRLAVGGIHSEIYNSECLLKGIYYFYQAFVSWATKKGQLVVIYKVRKADNENDKVTYVLNNLFNSHLKDNKVVYCTTFVQSAASAGKPYIILIIVAALTWQCQGCIFSHYLTFPIHQMTPTTVTIIMIHNCVENIQIRKANIKFINLLANLIAVFKSHNQSPPINSIQTWNIMNLLTRISRRLVFTFHMD